MKTRRMHIVIGIRILELAKTLDLPARLYSPDARFYCTSFLAIEMDDSQSLCPLRHTEEWRI